MGQNGASDQDLLSVNLAEDFDNFENVTYKWPFKWAL